MMSDLFEGRVFNSVEEINQRFGVEVELPEDISEGCNLLCYEILEPYKIELIGKYKEDDFLYAALSYGMWTKVNESLEKEILHDLVIKGFYIYLRLNKEEAEKEVFKPERLLGVETTKGFINEIYYSQASDLGFHIGLTYEYKDKSGDFRLYISDDSDETVSFQEYLDMFYSRG